MRTSRIWRVRYRRRSRNRRRAHRACTRASRRRRRALLASPSRNRCKSGTRFRHMWRTPDAWPTTRRTCGNEKDSPSKRPSCKAPIPAISQAGRMATLDHRHTTTRNPLLPPTRIANTLTNSNLSLACSTRSSPPRTTRHPPAQGPAVDRSDQSDRIPPTSSFTHPPFRSRLPPLPGFPST